MNYYVHSISLELDNLSDSFFTKKFLEQQLQFHTQVKIDTNFSEHPKATLSSAHRFFILSNFHDAKLQKVTATEIYGQKAIEIKVCFTNSTGIYKHSNKYQITFIGVSNFVNKLTTKDITQCYILDAFFNEEEYTNVVFYVECFNGYESTSDKLEITCKSVEIHPLP